MNGITGGNWRVRAAAYLHRHNGCTLIVSGGKSSTPHQEKAPTIAAVMKHELVTLGVKERCILVEDRSTSTYEQLKNCAPLVTEHRTEGLVEILTSEWHRSRVQALLHTLIGDNFLVSSYGTYHLLSAEKVLLNIGPEFGDFTWAQQIATARSSIAMEQRIQMELQGIAAIANGSYKPK